MRLHLLLIFCFVLTAWSGQVGAAAMAHCQEHEKTAVQLLKEQPHKPQHIANSHAQRPDKSTLAPQMPVHAAHQPSHATDCCDHSTDHHHCSGSCASCDGCSTANGAVIPNLLTMASAIPRQKIQYFDDFYLQSPGSTQERPPKY
jgi:hypothetical protein